MLHCRMTLGTVCKLRLPLRKLKQKSWLYTRDATILDFVGTIIVWGIIMVLRLLWLCIYSFHNIKPHKHSLDIKVLFIAAFWNRNNTVTNNTAQNNTKERKLELKRWPLLCKHPCQYFPFGYIKWKCITNVLDVFILYILSTFLLDLRYFFKIMNNTIIGDDKSQC